MASIDRRSFLHLSSSALLLACAGPSSLSPDATQGPAGATTASPAPGAPGRLVLPPLPYAYDALEPAIDAETMALHHQRHHQAYINGFNAALEQEPSLADVPLLDLLRDVDRVPEAQRDAVRNHGGGHHNHALFWTSLCAGGAALPEGPFQDKLRRSFGTLEAFRSAFLNLSMGVFGSGWGWLVQDPQDGTLSLLATPNQDSPWMEHRAPLCGIDVWEHAYYLRYQNRRRDYLDAVFGLLDWPAIAARATTA